MRFRMALVTTMLTAGLIAGCQGGGESERQALIDERIKSCADDFNKTGAGAAAGIDGQQLCTCALGKMTEGKSAGEIRAIAKQSSPSQGDLQAMGACLVEEAQRKGLLAK